MGIIPIDDCKKYLIYIDRNKKKSWDFYKAVIKPTDNIKYFTISEYKGSNFYINFRTNSINYSTTYWEIYRNLDIDDIVNRCRLLRSLPLQTSRVYISCALSYFIDLFNKHYFDFIIMFAVDRYTLHILAETARYYNIKIIGVGGSYIRRSKRITIFGEINKVRNAPYNEVNEVYEAIKRSYSSPGKPTKRKAIHNFVKTYLSTFIRYLLHYLVYHKLLNKLQYDYLIVKSQWNNISLFNFLYWFKFFKIKSDKDLDSIDINNSIYIPLHYFPEATVDYWTDHYNKAHYYETIFEVISYFETRGIDIYIKEHPAMFLIRNKTFYKTIIKFNHVSIINPFIETTKVLSHIQKVIIWTGSTGIESLVNNKSVYLYSKNFWDNNQLLNWKEYDKDYILDKKKVIEILQKYLENIIYE